MAGGRNSRFDEIQAAVLSTFLPQLDTWNERRRVIAARYSEGIHRPFITVPPKGDLSYVAHLYVIRSLYRNKLSDHLRRANIASEIHYPIPDYRQPFFGNRFEEINLEHTEQLCAEILTLPCYPEMSDKIIDDIIVAINSWHI